MILAFVYLGDKLPKYVLANMHQVKRNFADYEIVFISDSAKTCRKVENEGFSVWVSPDPETSWSISRYSLSHDPEFRDGFWFRTLARFFSLNEFLKTRPGEHCVLIESDVWISPSFPFFRFTELSKPFAFPLTTSTQGVASTLYIRSQEVLSHFLNFSISEVKRDPNSTDVTILAEYRKSYPNLVFILPSGPIEVEGYNSSFTDLEVELLSNSLEFKHEIFDGSTWGQFLTGEEPRNSWGFRNVYHSQSHHAVDTSKFRFSVRNKEVFAHIGTSSYRVNSLHIHSKDIRIFKKDSFLLSRVLNYRGKMVQEPVLKYIIRFIPSRIKFQLRKIVKKKS